MMVFKIYFLNFLNTKYPPTDKHEIPIIIRVTINPYGFASSKLDFSLVLASVLRLSILSSLDEFLSVFFVVFDVFLLFSVEVLSKVFVSSASISDSWLVSFGLDSLVTDWL